MRKITKCVLKRDALCLEDFHTQWEFPIDSVTLYREYYRSSVIEVGESKFEIKADYVDILTKCAYGREYGGLHISTWERFSVDKRLFQKAIEDYGNLTRLEPRYDPDRKLISFSKHPDSQYLFDVSEETYDLICTTIIDVCENKGEDIVIIGNRKLVIDYDEDLDTLDMTVYRYDYVEFQNMFVGIDCTLIDVLKNRLHSKFECVGEFADNVVELDNIVIKQDGVIHRIPVDNNELWDWLTNPNDIRQIKDNTYVCKNDTVYICGEVTYSVNRVKLKSGFDYWDGLSAISLTFYESDGLLSTSRDVYNRLELRNVTREQCIKLCDNLLDICCSTESGTISIGDYILDVVYKDEYLKIDVTLSGEYIGSFSYNCGSFGRSIVDAIIEASL